MAPHHLPLRRLLPAVAVALAVTLGLTLLPAAAQPRSTAVVDDYAAYEPQTTCSPTPKPAMEYLARWLVRRFGGEYGGISRACGGSRSEHKEGRAFDWTMDADDAGDQRRVQRFLKKMLRTDRRGNEHALARRMGIMYIIWDDQMYALLRPLRAQALPPLGVPVGGPLLPDVAPPRPRAHLAEPRGRGRGDQLVRPGARAGPGAARRPRRAAGRGPAGAGGAGEAGSAGGEAGEAGPRGASARRAAQRQPDLAPDLRWVDDIARPSLGFVS